jgi:hypothetical protein
MASADEFKTVVEWGGLPAFLQPRLSTSWLADSQAPVAS